MNDGFDEKLNSLFWALINIKSEDIFSSEFTNHELLADKCLSNNCEFVVLVSKVLVVPVDIPSPVLLITHNFAVCRP